MVTQEKNKENLMKVIEGKLALKGKERIAIINARFNHFITDRLTEGAKDAFLRHGGKEENLELILVPGAFELPMALDRALASGKYDAICCLGAVIKGDTPHFDYVSAEATKGIASVTLKYDKPVTYGLLTTNTVDQAMDRAGIKVGNKGFEAMTGLIEMIDLYRDL
jgi:6,7-dimethyl-8-ribityllumazine synthase